MAPFRPVADQRGFTLVELLVSMLILAIMAAIALPAFYDQRAKGEDTDAKMALKTAATAVVTYAMGTGTYNATVPELVEIEPALSEARNLSVAGDIDSFVLAADSGSGTRFTLSRDATGRTARDCSEPDFGLCRRDPDAAGNRW